MTNLERSIKYCNDILNENIISNNFIKQSCKVYLSFLDNDLYYFDNNEVDKLVDFIERLNLSDDYADKKFILSDWQILFISAIYGIKYKETGLRKHSTAILEISRKNAKSQLAVAFAMWDLLTSSQGQAIMVSTSRETLKEVNFKKAKQYAEQIDQTKKFIKQHYNTIQYGDNKLIALASDAGKHQGYSPSVAIIDEIHEYKTGELLQVFQRGMGSRIEPLTIIITSSGNDISCYYYSLRQYLIDVLFCKIEDNNLFGLIFCLDADDDYTDESVWIKANPNLGVSCRYDYLKGEVNKAKNLDIERNSILVYNFGRWLKLNSFDQWIDEVYYNNSFKDINIEDFYGLDCYMGIDLASTEDITAVSYLFEREGIVYFINRYYLPESALKSNVNRELYLSNKNNIKIVAGNVTDYDIVLEDIIEMNKHINIQYLYYDKFNATQFIINLTNRGIINSLPFSQMPGSLNQPLKEFERLIKSDKLYIEKNNISRWMLNNVILNIDKRGNYSIDKSSRSKKIDGVAAMINALGCYLSNPVSGFNIW